MRSFRVAPPARAAHIHRIGSKRHYAQFIVSARASKAHRF
jgi:hypothetical protein